VWRGAVRLRLEGDENPLSTAECRVEPLGRQVVTIGFQAPAAAGDYTLIAELTDGNQVIQSLRVFRVTESVDQDE
jgi:hypothetical protein